MMEAINTFLCILLTHIVINSILDWPVIVSCQYPPPEEAPSELTVNLDPA